VRPTEAFMWPACSGNGLNRGVRCMCRLLVPAVDMFNYAPRAEKRTMDGGSFYLEYHQVMRHPHLAMRIHPLWQ
jgi:hypothetical protein